MVVDFAAGNSTGVKKLLRGDPMGMLIDRADELFEEQFSIAANGDRVRVVRLLGGVSGTAGASGDEKSTEDIPSEGVCGTYGEDTTTGGKKGTK